MNKSNQISLTVISLDSRPDRRAHMSEALKGIDFTFFPAVDSSDPANDWLTEGRKCSIRGIEMKRGEHACHASHCLAWSEAQRNELPAVIVLEDDVIVTDDFRNLLRLDWIPVDADIVKLESYFGEVELGRPVSHPLPGRSLRKLHSPHYGAAAYLITAKGLQTLTRMMDPLVLTSPVDVALFDRHSPVFQEMTIYQMDPAPVIQMEFLNPDAEVSRSNLLEGRMDATNNGAAYGNHMSLPRRAKRAVLRLQSFLRKRRRVNVAYR